MSLLRACLTIACILFSSIPTSLPCKPAKPPSVQLGGCITSLGGDASKVINSVNEGDTYCIYKYAWTSGGSVSNAKEVHDGEYLKEYGYEEPTAEGMGSSTSSVVQFDKSCGASTPDTPNYAVTQWFCLEWCETNCINMNKWKATSSSYPFQKINCQHTGMECTDTINCECTDMGGDTCSVKSKGMPNPTVKDMINKYNSSCLNCHYKRPNAICTWQSLIGGGDGGGGGGSGSSSISSTHKQSSSVSTTTNTDTSSGVDQVNCEDQNAQADSGNSKTQVSSWVSHNEASQTTDSPPPTSMLKKRKTTAIISTPESTATDDEKKTANDPEMKDAVQSAKDKRAARKAARAKYWQDLADALTKFKAAKHVAFAAAIEKLKALKKARKGLKGKARKANKKESKKVIADLAGMMEGLRKDKTAAANAD